MDTGNLAAHGAPAELVERWTTTIPYLTDVQERAVAAGLLADRGNLLIAAPTSSGKTFVGEMAAATAAFGARRRAVFAVPYKALAEEHYDAMRARYEGLLGVVITDGDWSEFDDDIRRGDFNLAIATYEKLAALVGQFPEVLTRISTLVVDEVQMLGDETRGPGLERFLTRVLIDEAPRRLIALSASLDDLAPLERWLRATAVVSAERPVPLVETSCDLSGSVKTLNDGRLEEVTLFPGAHDRDQLIVSACAHLAREGKQVLVFRTAVASTRTTAEAIARALPAVGHSGTTGEELARLEDSENVTALSKVLASGVAFHNADLTHLERKVVEGAFRRGDARVLVSTTTLAMGVNLPSDWVVVADTSRFSGGRLRDIPIAEYKNAAGRAGRLGHREAGFSVILADDPVQARQLINEFVEGQPEAVESQVPRRPFEDLVFSVVCDGLAQDEGGLTEFATATLAYQTFYEPRGDGIAVIREAITGAVSRCLDAGLLVRDGASLIPTPSAKQFAQAGLGVNTAVRLAREITDIPGGGAAESDLLFAAASCAEAGDRPWVPTQFRQTLDPRTVYAIQAGEHRPDGALATAMSRAVLSDNDKAALVRFVCLTEWVSGVPVRELSRRYRGAAPVRVQTLGKNAAWLLETLARAADLTGQPAEVATRARDVAVRCRYGVPLPVVSLARLRAPGVTRETLVGLATNSLGVSLFDPDEVMNADVEDFRGLLTPAQLAALKATIERDTADTIARRRVGHLGRAEQANLPKQLVAALYTSEGGGFEQAVAEALAHLGLPASRVLRQPHGEEDIRLAHAGGTIVISVTASRDEGKPVAWTKAREVLGQGAGLNPINFVCVARPRFDSLATRQANDIAREAGERKLLLLSLPAFSELFVRCCEGRMAREELSEFLARQSGCFDVENLPEL